MKMLKNGLFGSLFLVFIFSFLTGTAYSQDSSSNNKMYNKEKSTMHETMKYDNDVKQAAQDLKNKVDLTAVQTTQVEGMLQEFKPNSSKNMTASNDQIIDKIENVLTADQKTKFNDIKTQWWASTQKSLSKISSQKSSKSN